MKITVVCAGKLKEKYWRDACGEYEKRLSARCNITVREIPDEPCPEKLSEAQRTDVAAPGRWSGSGSS